MPTETPTRRAAGRAPASGSENGRALRLARVFRVVPARVGRHVSSSAKIQLGLIGDVGAVHLDVTLNWFPGELSAKARSAHPPQGVGLFVHRRKPADRPGFPVSHGPCEWLDLDQCFTDTLSAVAADGIAELLRDLGDAAVWEALEQLYRERLQ